MMNDVPLCSITVGEQLAAADLEELEMALQMDFCKLQQPTKRLFGVDDTFVLLVAGVVSGAAGAAQLLDFGIKVGKAIIDWRKKMRTKDLDACCILEHPRRPPLDLRTASDDEILEWFQR
jgi:hypothetical protein